MKAPRVKKLSIDKKGLIPYDVPNFNISGSVKGMRKLYYGNDALLVKCGQYIYNVTAYPDLYNIHAT